MHLRAIAPFRKAVCLHTISRVRTFRHCTIQTRSLKSSIMASNGSSTNGTSAATRHVPVTYAITNDQPVLALDAKSAFEKLSGNEQLYAHYLCRASFYGGLIVLVQTSPESPAIYRLIQRVNAQSIEELKKAVVGKDGVNDDDFQAYLVFCSGVYANMGNYKGFGDSKIVPDILPERLETIIQGSKAWAEDKTGMAELWSLVKEKVFSLDDRAKQLGLGSKGVTTYFTPNCSEQDAQKVTKFMNQANVEGYITRVIKKDKGGEDGRDLYEIRHAAVDSSVRGNRATFEGADFVITAGDYSKLLLKVNENLREAAKFAANDTEKKMLEQYIKSFREGDLEAHKNGSRHWIQNKGPTVETYIGFIETYRDPVGMRGEFEGFVAMVNKEQSAKFGELVNAAEKFIGMLPWPKEFEKDKFLRPDFTSLDVLAFGGSGIPAGINIPNYDEIRQSEGFKNVSLGNVIAASYKADQKTPFLSMEDHNLMKEYQVATFEIQVGLHELLGHGSGKLLRRNDDGSLNFARGLINPLTNSEVDQMYEKGETYDSKFTSLGSAYEECRAEAVGLHLCFNDEVLRIFGVTDPQKKSDSVYVNWLSLCHAGVRGVEMYSPAASEWKQAHCQARFVILNVLIEAGQGFVTLNSVTGEDGQPDLLLTMDRNKLESVGRPAISEFLKKLQVYKSLGDVDNAKKMFDHFSEVNETWLQWRDIAISRKRPRKILVQANTVVNGEKVDLLEYPNTHEGMLASWRERFSPDEAKEIDDILVELEKREAEHFSV